MGQPILTRPTQPSNPPESVLSIVIHVITAIMGVETIKRQTKDAYGCLIIDQSLWAQA